MAGREAAYARTTSSMTPEDVVRGVAGISLGVGRVERLEGAPATALQFERWRMCGRTRGPPGASIWAMAWSHARHNRLGGLSGAPNLLDSALASRYARQV